MLLVIPFFRQVIGGIRVPILEVLHIMLDGRSRRKIIITKIACLMISCWWEAIEHISGRKRRFIECTCNSYSDWLSSDISQYIFNGASPTSINHVTGEGAGNLKREIERFVFSRRVSVDIVKPAIRSIRQGSRKEPCFTYCINRGRIQPFERSTPDSCNVHCFTPIISLQREQRTRFQPALYEVVRLQRSLNEQGPPLRVPRNMSRTQHS